ncbi:hypothetical protein AOR13_3425 [Alteromonas stellipolaris LMG 21856]|nr:hypothetical protein AOR13_3425 [Alteromonas stellipolaris LMG 21856]
MTTPMVVRFLVFYRQTLSRVGAVYGQRGKEGEVSQAFL